MVTHARVSPRVGPAGRLGRVRSAGRVEGSRGLPAGPLRRFDGYVLACLVRGRGRYRDPVHDVPLEPGDLVLVVPGRPHWYGADGPQPWDDVHLVFDGPVFDLAARQGLLDVRSPVRRLRPVQQWADRIDAFRTRRPPRSAAGADDEVCDVLRLLVDVSAHDGPAAGGRGWLAESQARLAADLSVPLALPEVAAATGMPYDTWRRRFRAETGTPPARYRLLRRIDAARDLLRRTSMDTRDIAESLGFGDEHHLARQFRRVTGRTTRQFRRDAG